MNDVFSLAADWLNNYLDTRVTLIKNNEKRIQI